VSLLKEEFALLSIRFLDVFFPARFFPNTTDLSIRLFFVAGDFVISFFSAKDRSNSLSISQSQSFTSSDDIELSSSKKTGHETFNELFSAAPLPCTDFVLLGVLRGAHKVSLAHKVSRAHTSIASPKHLSARELEKHLFRFCCRSIWFRGLRRVGSAGELGTQFDFFFPFF